MLREEDRARIDRYGKIGDDLHTDLHECLGHGSGQLAPGVKGDELKSYGSTLEETRADLFGLYYLGDLEDPGQVNPRFNDPLALVRQGIFSFSCNAK